MIAQIANEKGTVKSIQPAQRVHAGQLASIGQSFARIQLRINATIGIAGGNGNFLVSCGTASKQTPRSCGSRGIQVGLVLFSGRVSVAVYQIVGLV
jgi:hypothetical protein